MSYNLAPARKDDMTEPQSDANPAASNTQDETPRQDDLQTIENRQIVETESASEWVFNWSGNAGEYELAYVNAREVWLRRARYSDPDGAQGGWNEPQEVALEVPKTYDEAKAIAESFIRRR